MPRYFLVLCFSFSILRLIGQNAPNVDSLWKVHANTTLHDSVRLHAAVEIARYVMNVNPDSALTILDLAFDLASRTADNHNMGRVCHLRGIIYKNQGQYSLSVENYLACLGYWEKTGNDSGIAICHQTLANVYGRLRQIEKARVHYDTALSMYGVMKMEASIGSLYNDMGNMYLDINDTIALECLRKSLAIRKKLNIEKGIANSGYNMAGVFLKRGMADSALFYVQPYYEYGLKYNRKGNIISSITAMGNVFIMKGDPARGRDSCLRALQMNEEHLQNLEHEEYACDCLHEAYLALGDHEEALKYYKRFIAVRDTLNRQSQRDEVTRLEYEFLYEKKVEEDSLRTAKEMEVVSAKAAGERNLRYALFAGLGLTAIFGFVMFNRFRTTRRQKNLIIQQQIETQLQSKVIEEKNKEITDSINYAQRIQNAVLPSELELKKAFTDIFVLLNPRDIVSGDFYWYDESKNNKIIAVADCTGHGVPGGFMSMLGSEILQDVVMLEEVTTTADAMRRLDEKVTIRLNKNDKAYRDGMDLALCAFTKNKMELHFSGANRPLLHFSNGIMTTIKPDKHTIGGAIDDVKKDFTNHVIPLQKGDMIYLFTDGYADQFGGNNGKKFMSKRLEELLTSIAALSCEEQKAKLETAYRVWKGTNEQVDDVCIVGIRI